MLRAVGRYMAAFALSWTLTIAIATAQATDTSVCTMENSAGCAAFTLRLTSGFFVQGDESIDDPAHYPPHLGLEPSKTWGDVDALLKDGSHKLVVFLRHGEALHNADKLRVGEKVWEELQQFLEEYIDAPLTATGIQQAATAGGMLKEEVEQRGLKIDAVIVSPLDRTLDTYAGAFKDVSVKSPVIAMELARETLGVCQCDRRKPIPPKKEAFPSIDFTKSIPTDDDSWWLPDHRETDAEIEERGRQFMNHLFYERSERSFVVVSHSGFTRGCLRALGHRYYRPANGEFIPVLLSDN
ncbi:hypothetical protein Poli38472_000896 [Pythium oligandrum]|uniref:Phosphoglycerate mutase n=1 Tax=Pythium oligandrum TaxID=41045 RepID=A0A8K1FHB7_PYTOL|nr:hypothetical protein Poli38472_000896 [Pythium oligandrum]|eukprot:TMW60854.1 hypothetical protein Poli38472_000896 [Pythium oligandrum]